MVGKRARLKGKKLIFDGQRSHPTKIIKKIFELLIMNNVLELVFDEVSNIF